jgi:5-methylcytosine-specific restriction protein A
MAKDTDYIRMIHTSRWLRLRRDKLTKHPLCERCESEGYLTAATEVHHQIPVEYGVTCADKERLMFDYSNLRALCHNCHVEVHIQMGRSGKAATKRRNDEQVAAMIKKYF